MASLDAPTGRRGKGSRPSDGQLLDGACAVFAARGYAAAGMDAIAEAAGCTKPTLYAHFASKQTIYLAVLRREAEQLKQWLFAAYDKAEGLHIHEQIRAGMAAIFDYAKAHPDGLQLVMGTEGEGHLAVWRQFTDDIISRVADLIRTNLARYGYKPGPEVAPLAAMTVGTAIFAILHTYRNHPGDPEFVLDLTTEYAERGLRQLADPLGPSPEI
ncbi:TetR/AcrR family transcriptional regulator [Amycolatopsis silviterrae]|uniref:TetR/AcrR family transcriptional regulator n=1 Tax=Amycolatopsis silviterrae TaxID=1656914 RepID=A0ABW5HFS7_9PSEU